MEGVATTFYFVNEDWSAVKGSRGVATCNSRGNFRGALVVMLSSRGLFVSISSYVMLAGLPFRASVHDSLCKWLWWWWVGELIVCSGCTSVAVLHSIPVFPKGTGHLGPLEKVLVHKGGIGEEGRCKH
ncbi:hypothetical protein M514_28107 [Trichuris suis]|uniref:Transmembrane protein n=1 Tax=Trichuris suis TaxID=68888 RepID=A0A085MR70_9BILA|nr:hypothetical protein M514_28107 [Trichuris suis]